MYIDQTDSTNSLMQRLLRGEEQEFAACLNADIPVLYTSWQTAGRGQTGNGWEAERGRNLLLTYLLRNPKVDIREQFMLNIIAAITTHRTISEWLTIEHRPMLTIKWPNDIYFDDRKIAGILVENSLSGTHIQHSIAGVGINVNQERWVGDAPNPVSIKMLQIYHHQKPAGRSDQKVPRHENPRHSPAFLPLFAHCSSDPFTA